MSYASVAPGLPYEGEVASVDVEKRKATQNAVIATAVMLGLLLVLLVAVIIWLAMTKNVPEGNTPPGGSPGRHPGPGHSNPPGKKSTSVNGSMEGNQGNLNQAPPGNVNLTDGSMNGTAGMDGNGYESVYQQADGQFMGRGVHEAQEAMPAIGGGRTNMNQIGSMQDYTEEEQKMVKESADKINAGLRSSFLQPMGTEYNDATRVGPTAQAMRTYEGTVRALSERDGGLDRKRSQIVGAWGGVLPNPAQRQGPNPNDSFLPFNRSELFATANPFYQEQYTLPSGRPIGASNDIVASDNF